MIGFVDTNNLIYSATGVFEYTPTQNCWLMGNFHTGGGRIYINDVLVYDVEDMSSSGIKFYHYMPIKAGQNVRVETHSTYTCYFYGMF